MIIMVCSEWRTYRDAFTIRRITVYIQEWNVEMLTSQTFLKRQLLSISFFYVHFSICVRPFCQTCPPACIQDNPTGLIPRIFSLTRLRALWKQTSPEPVVIPSAISLRGYRNWPRYGLRWSGLFCHSCTARVEPAKQSHRPAPRVLCRTGRTNHVSADRICGQFLFYNENEALHGHKCSDDEPPWVKSPWLAAPLWRMRP